MSKRQTSKQTQLQTCVLLWGLPIALLLYTVCAWFMVIYHAAIDNLFDLTLAIPSIVALYCILICLAFVKIHRTLADFFAYSDITLMQYIIWLGVLVFFLYATSWAHAYLHVPVVSEWEIYFSHKHLATPAFFLMILCVMPILEELLFRGILFDGLVRTTIGLPGAIIIPAYLWALPAGMDSSALFLVNIFMGVMFGVARWHTGTLWTPIFLHIIITAAAFLTLVN